MSIRLRLLPGVGWVALCAARSVEKPGDAYLDDGQHRALSIKFSLDFASMGFLSRRAAGMYVNSPEAAAMEREESNNPNRKSWDATYGPLTPEQIQELTRRAKTHKKNCPELLARTCTTPVECPHGYDCCPTCDPCTCNTVEAVVPPSSQRATGEAK